MTKLIIEQFPLEEIGGIDDWLTLLDTAADAMDKNADPRNLAAFARMTIARLSTDDDTPLEDALKEHSFQDIINLGLSLVKAEAVPPQNDAD